MLLVNPQNMHEISESTWISMPNILIILQTCVLWRRNWTLVLSCRKKTYSMQQRNATQWRTPFVERACCLASVCKRVAFQTYQVVIKNAATICKNRKRQIKKHNITSRYWSKKSLVSCSKKASYNAVISETTRRGRTSTRGERQLRSGEAWDLQRSIKTVRPPVGCGIFRVRSSDSQHSGTFTLYMIEAAQRYGGGWQIL